MSWYSLSTSTSSVGTHRYATRHAAARCGTSACLVYTFRLGALMCACVRL